MKIFSLLFILNTIYYSLFSERLILNPKNRDYKNLILVFFDLSYYMVELFYFFWMIGLLFLSIKFGIFFLVLEILRWIFLRANMKIYFLLKIILLICFFIN